MTTTSRRRFLQTVAATSLAASWAARSVQAAAAKLHVACNQFCWINMYGRQGKDFQADLDAGFAEVKRSGMDGVEAMLGDPAAAERIVPLLKKHGLAMRSFYTGATLHDAAVTESSIEQVVATAARAKQWVDLRIVVVNPTPLGGEGKSDEQLEVQAAAMTRLGQRLADLGLSLSYHFHAPAWQRDGREFHHVLTRTDPSVVQLCLDAHWVYRGSGNNVQRVYDVVQRYGSRVNELHIRQSRRGVWTESVTDGDIDYARVVSGLKSQGVKPLLVLEQAVEGGTPNTMDAVESHRRSYEYVQRVFAPLYS